MSTPLEEQVLELELKLAEAKTYRVISDILLSKISNNNKLIKEFGADTLDKVVRKIKDFSDSQALELETGKYVEKMELKYEDILIVKQMLEHLKNKNLK